jgi:hypothetical protein
MVDYGLEEGGRNQRRRQPNPPTITLGRLVAELVLEPLHVVAQQHRLHDERSALADGVQRSLFKYPR